MSRMMVISGAGSGIGRAAALELAREQPDLALVLMGRRRDALEATRRLLPHPERHELLVAGQDDRGALHRAIGDLNLTTRNVVGLVANAGVGGENHYGPGDRWDEIIGTNLTGTYNLVSELLPALLKAKDRPRHVVLVSSILARLGVPGYTAYCASKAGLLGLMRSLAAEHARDQVYVNAICPGWVDTEMAQQGIKGFASVTGKSYDDALKAQLAMVPTRKMSTPAEVGGLIAYLCSGRQTSFTGQCFDINNGALMP